MLLTGVVKALQKMAMLATGTVVLRWVLMLRLVWCKIWWFLVKYNSDCIEVLKIRLSLFSILLHTYTRIGDFRGAAFDFIVFGAF